MVKLEYKEIESQKVISRFGKLITNKGSFDMPFPSPGIRTKYDCEALIENIKNGLYPRMITPYASWRNSIMQDIKSLLGISYDQNDSEEKIIPVSHKILVIPDPEYEALSFHCTARVKFKEATTIDKNFETLLETGLSDKNKKQVESVWNNVTSNYGYTGIKDWATSILEGVESDIFLAPTHIIKANVTNSVPKAFEHGYNILDEAMSDAKFTLYGIHLLLHWNIFQENNLKSSMTRKQIYSELENWIDPRSRYSGLFLSFKVFDNNNRLSDQNCGTIRRKILSEFITEVSDRVRKADGAVITHNFGNWILGCMDSGSDIATFRMSGKTEIDKPLPIGKVSKKSSKINNKVKRSHRLASILNKTIVPAFTNYDTLTESDIEDIKRLWDKEGSFPLPSCIDKAIDFWNLNYHDQLVYCIRTRCGTFIELGEEYRKAGIDLDGIPLSEALRNRVKNSNISQELQDLCPSLGNILFSTYKEKTQFQLSQKLIESYVHDNSVDYNTVKFILINRVKNKLITKQELINILGEIYLDIVPLEKSNFELFIDKKNRFKKIFNKINREV